MSIANRHVLLVTLNYSQRCLDYCQCRTNCALVDVLLGIHGGDRQRRDVAQTNRALDNLCKRGEAHAVCDRVIYARRLSRAEHVDIHMQIQLRKATEAVQRAIKRGWVTLKLWPTQQ